MLSEEEKKAIKYFYNLRSTIDESYMLFDEEIKVKCGKDMIKQISLVLNLIAKLQKENEKIKKENEELKQENKRIKYFSRNLFINHYVAKIKIKDLIEKLKQNLNSDNNIKIYTLKDSYELQINVLQELLESGDENECKK